MDDDIKFELIGIAEMIKRDILTVPSNQREYSWNKEVQVKSFLQDITNSMGQNSHSYFLGTVVLTKKKNGVLEIADGQQRNSYGIGCNSNDFQSLAFNINVFSLFDHTTKVIQ